MKFLICFALICFTAIEVQAVITYFTYSNASSLVTSKASFSLNSSFGKWIGGCGELEYEVDPYTGLETYYRTVYLSREETLFNADHRTWKYLLSSTWKTTEFSSYCFVQLVNQGALILEIKEAGKVTVSHLGLDDKGFILTDIPSYLTTLSCPYSSSYSDYPLVARSYSGNVIAFSYCELMTVYQRGEKTNLWIQQGSVTQKMGCENTFQINNECNAILCQIGTYESVYLYEFNDSNIWQKYDVLPDILSSSDSFILVNSTMLIQSQPTYNQPIYDSAGQILVYVRSGSFKSFGSPILAIQLDPGKLDTENAQLEALEWIGEGSISAKIYMYDYYYTQYQMLIINFTSNVINYAINFHGCSTEYNYRSVTIACSKVIRGRNISDLAFLNSRSGTVFYPLGISLSLMRFAFFFTIIGCPILVVLLFLCCCCCCKIHKRNRLRYGEYRELEDPISSSINNSYHRNQTNVDNNITSQSYQHQNPPSYPGDNVITNTPGSSSSTRQLDPRIINSLGTVRQGILVAFTGIVTNKISTDDSISIIAFSVIYALQQSEIRSQQQIVENLGALMVYINSMISSVITDLSTREGLISLVVAKVGDLATRERKANSMIEALNGGKNHLHVVWNLLSDGTNNVENTIQLAVVVVVTSLKNWTLSTSELRGNTDTFVSWMMSTANEFAPNLPADTKKQIITKVWEQIA